jgi:hypothetical protein
MSGAYFFNLIIEGAMGIDVALDGDLTLRPVKSGFDMVPQRLSGLRTASGVFTVDDGKIEKLLAEKK